MRRSPKRVLRDRGPGLRRKVAAAVVLSSAATEAELKLIAAHRSRVQMPQGDLHRRGDPAHGHRKIQRRNVASEVSRLLTRSSHLMKTPHAHLHNPPARGGSFILSYETLWKRACDPPRSWWIVHTQPTRTRSSAPESNQAVGGWIVHTRLQARLLCLKLSMNDPPTALVDSQARFHSVS